MPGRRRSRSQSASRYATADDRIRPGEETGSALRSVGPCPTGLREADHSRRQRQRSDDRAGDRDDPKEPLRPRAAAAVRDQNRHGAEPCGANVVSRAPAARHRPARYLSRTRVLIDEVPRRHRVEIGVSRVLRRRLLGSGLGDDQGFSLPAKTTHARVTPCRWSSRWLSQPCAG